MPINNNSLVEGHHHSAPLVDAIRLSCPQSTIIKPESSYDMRTVSITWGTYANPPIYRRA
ncbi:hypothetical protein M404DRAFT_1008045 [Pisolithus tinctorius Marx 270]|uniref:Uncharacterized protein n=1 Tax=Pisolithus tinctorius Marx 270 TaxID=870435 RepID=A0A0C3JAR7_PISTI|nr:hypothetical protein M404DRAFT_1008045 [Pisolithus tinctorius Marx 270]